MKFKFKHLFWILALLTGFSFDRLFWENPFGINFSIFILLVILGGLLPLWLENIRVPWTSYLLLIPILFFTTMTFIRAEPFSTAANVLITLGSLTILSITLLNGAWYKLRIRDHVVNIFKFVLNTIVGGILFFTKINKTPSSPQNEEDDQAGGDNESASVIVESNPASSKNKLLLKKAAPYLRGILITVPILAILTALLASADPVFNERIQHFFSWFELDNLGENLFRLFYILLFAYVILSAYYYGLVESKKWDEKELEDGKPRPFLGSIEATIILSAVNLLFLLFVILQFTYLFGGQRNINIDGFTYAEYARRGFSELIAVAVISLLVFYVLSMFTKRKTKAKRWTFSILGLILVGLVGIILASAYKRLTLYEAAYGFTRLRTLTHVFMIWIALLLAAIAALEISRKMERLAFILICFVFGFGLTINVLNIDPFIVRQNIARSIDASEVNALAELDTGYLYSLSVDSIPPLVNFFNDSETPERLRNEIGGVLACRLADFDNAQERPWMSWHYAHTKAVDLLKDQSEALEAYPVSQEDGLFVEVNGEVRSCNGYLLPPD